MAQAKNNQNVEEVLQSLPPNYPVGGIYLNGVFVPTFSFSNLCDCIAYFTDDEGQIIAVNVKKIDGITFGEAEAEGC